MADMNKALLGLEIHLDPKRRCTDCPYYPEWDREVPILCLRALHRDLLAALKENKLEPKTMTFVHADEESAPSMLLLCAKKGAAPSLNISAPLILHSTSDKGGNRPLSPRAQKIYDTMSFED